MSDPDSFVNNLLVRFNGLSKRFGQRQIFSDVDIELYASQNLLLIGENGSGKSTLLRIMSGLLKPDSGNVFLNNEQSESEQSSQQELSWSKQQGLLRSQIMYMHQMPYMFDGSVEKNLSYAVSENTNADEKNEQLQKALQWSGLESLAANSAKQLSGGEKQRVALARAWLRKSQILLLDEPTANLDQTSRMMTLELLESLKESGVSLVVSCHEYEEFLRISDSTLSLSNGVLQKI